MAILQSSTKRCLNVVSTFNSLIPHLKRCLNDLLGRTNFKTPIFVSSHEGVKYIRTPPEIRVESLRSLTGILRCHPKSACSNKMVFAELTFANRKIHTFYWHGRERRPWAGAVAWDWVLGRSLGRVSGSAAAWSEVGASIFVVRRILLDLWCMGLHGSRKPSRRPEGLGSPHRSRTSHFAGLQIVDRVSE